MMFPQLLLLPFHYPCDSVNGPNHFSQLTALSLELDQLSVIPLYLAFLFMHNAYHNDFMQPFLLSFKSASPILPSL